MADGAEDTTVNFLYKTMMERERDPNKRQVKPVTHEIMDLNFAMEDSSDDSDYKIDETHDESDEDNAASSEGNSSSEEGSEEESAEEEEHIVEDKSLKYKDLTVEQILEKLKNRKQSLQEVKSTTGIKAGRNYLICCICLGDVSLDTDEVVECDGCGASVHEACYGISDTGSVASTVSSSSTEPWFCEACRAGVRDPDCELCPIKGGIFKETDVGSWVHLVCALYTPGLAFGDLDKLSAVTLFEINYSLWGGKTCCLCEDERFARTGVCISCDAGLCKTYFHVSCAQREGLLHDGHSDPEQNDPFYAHCKLHSDKNKIRQKKRNWLALQSRMKIRAMEIAAMAEKYGLSDRISRKLKRQQEKHSIHKIARPVPWVPTQKMPRLMTSSPAAVRALLHKAELMGLDTHLLETVECQQQAVANARKKWHIPAAFSVEFTSYYLDRNVRIAEMTQKLAQFEDDENKIQEEQNKWKSSLDDAIRENEISTAEHNKLLELVNQYHGWLRSFSAKPDLPLPKFDTFQPIPQIKPVQNSSFLKAAQRLKAPTTVRTTIEEVKPEPEIPKNCFVCNQSENQHLLVCCDTCTHYYHLACLDPPLTRMPKKTKLYGWQCSDCNPGSSSSEDEYVDTTAPRQLRKGVWMHKEPDQPVSEEKKVIPQKLETNKPPVADSAPVMSEVPKKKKKNKKKRRKEDKKKGIKITIKNVSMNALPGYELQPISDSNDSLSKDSLAIFGTDTASIMDTSPPKPKRQKLGDARTHCDKCTGDGNNGNLVRCDHCKRCFHWNCLNPPASSNPKPRGWSWFCESCDSSENEEEKDVVLSDIRQSVIESTRFMQN